MRVFRLLFVVVVIVGVCAVFILFVLRKLWFSWCLIGVCLVFVVNFGIMVDCFEF